ncbi:MAG: AmmeMemoRadiSam system protein B [Candidatus Omnitrophota bacterium]
MRLWQRSVFVIIMLCFCVLSAIQSLASSDIKEPNVAGQFYPSDKVVLKQTIEKFLAEAHPSSIQGDIFSLIEPHAGYEFSGPTAAFGYKSIQGRHYKTVVVIGPAHFFPFAGISIYPQGKFHTPLGDLDIDSGFAAKLIDPKAKTAFIPQAFEKEHSVEIQLPFLQVVLSNFRIVPVVIGDTDLPILESFAKNLVKAISQRKDVLIIVSSDLCHSYDFELTESTDAVTLLALQHMSGREFYAALREGKAQMCGGFPAVVALLASKMLGFDKVQILSATNTALVTGLKVKGQWTVGYAAGVISNAKL